MERSQQILLEAVKAALFGAEPSYPDDADWDEVMKEARAQTVSGVISPVVPVHDESAEQTKANYMRILYEQNNLIRLLEKNDVPCVILKGCAAAVYYPKPYLRTMGDVDFLVPHDRFDAAVRAMDEGGYKYIVGKDENGQLLKQAHHIEYVKNGIVFELHHHLAKCSSDLDALLDDAVSRREYHDINGFTIPMLPGAENGLVLLQHIHNHLKESRVGLRQIIDWEMYFYHAMDDEKWSGFARIARKEHLETLAVCVTRMCERYLGLPHSVDLPEGSADDISDELMGIILDDGNFGRRSTVFDSYDEMRLKRAVFSLRKKGAFRYFQNVGLETWGLCKKHPVLKPFAWIYGIARCTAKGTKPFLKSRNVTNYIDGFSYRTALFKRLGLNGENEAAD